MIHFLAWQLGKALMMIRGMESDASYHCNLTDNPQRRSVEKEYVEQHIVGYLKHARRQCEAIELAAALARIDKFELACKIDLSWQEFYHQAKTLREAIESELCFRRFAFVPTDRSIRLDRVERDWSKALAHFPNAHEDVVAAVECYALDCNTASVFHSMRVAEYGLRALASAPGIKRVGKQKHRLEYAEWGLILNEMNGKLKAVQQSQGRGPKKAAKLKFFADAHSHADHLNEIWRKDVAHARGPYNAPEALNALDRTGAFMELLSANLGKSKN